VVKESCKYLPSVEPDGECVVHISIPACRLVCFASSIAFFSKSSMKKLAMTGEIGELMATPSVCSET